MLFRQAIYSNDGDGLDKNADLPFKRLNESDLVREASHGAHHQIHTPLPPVSPPLPHTIPSTPPSLPHISHPINNSTNPLNPPPLPPLPLDNQHRLPLNPNLPLRPKPPRLHHTIMTQPNRPRSHKHPPLMFSQERRDRRIERHMAGLGLGIGVVTGGRGG